MLNLFHVSSELFVRQTVYVNEFLVSCLTKYFEVFYPNVYNFATHGCSFQSVLYAPRYIVSDVLFDRVNRVTLLK